MNLANEVGAYLAVILGEDEIKKGVVSIKRLIEDKEKPLAEKHSNLK